MSGVAFDWDPDTYLALMHEEIPDYERLQAELVRATGGTEAHSILELGTGTGETTRRLLAAHPRAQVVGIDSSPSMLAAARESLAEADVLLQQGRLEDPLPDGRFELIVSALAVHHLDDAGKQRLFSRVAARLGPGGRFVLADLVRPDDPGDMVTPIDGVYDRPSSAAEQLGWLLGAGLRASVRWEHRDLAVLAAEPLSRRCRSGPARLG